MTKLHSNKKKLDSNNKIINFLQTFNQIFNKNNSVKNFGKVTIFNEKNKLKQDLIISTEKSILKGLLKNNIKVKHRCMNGTCNLCACSVIKGKENIISSSNQELEKDIILPCCCKIKKNKTVELKIKNEK